MQPVLALQRMSASGSTMLRLHAVLALVLIGGSLPGICSLNASETASSLLSPDQDSLAVLQSHLLTQQQKLQKYMDSLAGNIANSIPGHASAVQGIPTVHT
jgi:hypothetical protein